MEERSKFQFLYDMDLFGKTPELYFQRKSKKSTELGVTLTIIYIIIYIAFFIYKLIRMVKRMDVTFYDTYAYKDFPYINITNEEFYGAFLLGTGIDETIYYPRGQFVYNVKGVSGFDIERIEELEVETCDINKFGSRFRELYKDKNLDNLYCMKKVNGTLEGYANLERYSYISVQFYPCFNKTKDGRDCKPKEFLQAYLKTNIIEFKMQDNLLSPEIYETPVQAEEKDINTPVFLSLYQYIYSYIQIVILETDEDITGLNFWSKNTIEKYPKYDESYIITAPPNGDVLDTGGPLCEVNLQLAAKVLTTKRKYMTLLDVLGDVGGLMEIIYSFFNLIASFLTDISYEKSIVNQLFKFNIDKREIIIRKKKNRNIRLKKSEIIESISLDKIDKKEINENESEKNEKENNLIEPLDNIINISNNSKYRSKNKFNNKDTNLDLKKKESNEGSERPIIEENNEQMNELNNLKKNKVEIYTRDMKNEKDTIITKIKMNICCYCFLSRKKSIDVNLLDEGMNVITEVLDIMNIFSKMYQNELIKDKLLYDLGNILMSDTCKYNLDIFIKEKDNIRKNINE